MQMTKPKCPHCDQEMSLWEVPPINFSDGLGWGEPFLFVCFNEEYPAYAEGWKHMEETYAHRASYRCMNTRARGSSSCRSSARTVAPGR